jgi:hypothetical protein
MRRPRGDGAGWDKSPRLRRYYRELGYRELGAVTLGGYEARLFEKAL